MANNQTAKLLQVEFNLAVRRREAQNLSGTQWEVNRKVIDQAEQHRREEKQDFKLNYEARLQKEKERLINKGGELHQDYKPPWITSDEFDTNQIARQAARNIKAEHDAKLFEIDKVELKALDKLVEGAKLREKHKAENAQSLNQQFNEGVQKPRRQIQ